MKTYDEIFQSVLARRDEYEKQKRKKRIFLLRTSAVGLGAAAVIGLGVFTGIMKPPKRPSPEQSGIIKVTETTAVTETVSETAETQTKKPVQTTTAASTKESNINTSTQTTVSTSVKTETSRSSDSETVTSKTSPRSSTTPAVTSARFSASAARSTSRTRQTTTVKTTARTTATHTSAVTVTTRTTATQNAETTKNADTTKGAMGTFTWTMAAETMTTTTKKANDSPKSTISTAYSYDFMISLCFAGITVDDVKYEKTLGDQEADSLGEYITDITLVPTMFTDYLPAEINAQVYAIKDISPKCEIAVKFDGLDYYKTYYTVMFERQTLGELIDNLGLEKNMDVKRAVINYQKYQIETDRFKELILSARDAEAAASNENIGNDYLGYVIIDLLDIKKSIRFIMTDKGYLHSTIMTENGSLNYYIGEDKINEFLEYVQSCPTIE